MKIKSVKIKNFRGYKEETEIFFNNLTVFVGRNDIGKSTVLEALDLFFNEGKGTVKFEKEDINVTSDDKEYWIEVVFSEIPDEIILDATYKTSLKEEYMLNKNSDLDIIKKFNGSKCNATYIKAFHPINKECENLLNKKITELKSIIKADNVECSNLTICSVMRKAIWKHYENKLDFSEIFIDISSGEDTKKIWQQLSNCLPIYFLFQSDRSNTDGDKEVQDPMKAAVAQFLKDTKIQETLNEVAEKVLLKLNEVSERTLEKLKEMDEDIAENLKPVIPSVESLKWADVFKNVSITSDDNIPINKRGSGVKRLILLNFFRAEAERRQEESNGNGIIYAIEEPETSQHFANQRLLAKALISLANTANTQVIMTTHSGVIVKTMDYLNLRLVKENENKCKTVCCIENGVLPYISLNEINYTAFGEVTEEYHDELYGFICLNEKLQEYERDKEKILYKKLNRNGSIHEEERTLTHYIRDVLHHPENDNNPKYTYDDLKKSVEEMRLYIQNSME